MTACAGSSSEVLFLPGGKSAALQPGEILLDGALAAGIDIEHECGGNCACTTCQVYIETGAAFLSPMEDPERNRLRDAEDLRPESRLSCQALLLGGAVTVTIPAHEHW